jgi:hypothetical protein
MAIPFILPNIKPSVVKLQRELAYFFPELTHFYGYAGTPDHNTKRCLDAMVYDSSGKYVGQQGRTNLPYSQRIALGDRVLAFLRENANRYHLNGVIWNRHVYGFPGAGQTGNYRGPFNTARPYKLTAHDDHLHIDQDGRDFESLIPDVPFIWDGASFPGAARFGEGVTGPWITYLGQRLVAHGYKGYEVGPGPEWGAADRAGVQWAQEQQGFTGADADGIPGAQTWAWLAADPVVAPPMTTPVVKPPVVKPPTSNPTPEPKPEPTVENIETILGWNILRRTDNLAGRDRYTVRKARIGKTLRDAKASVYLLIETDQQSRKDAGAALGDGFSYWGFKYYGVYWEQSVWERRGDATNEFLFRDKNNRWLLSLPLFHKKSGKQITFDVTHLENDGDPISDGHSARKVEVTHLVEKASKGDRVGFFDCNSTTPAVIAKPTARQNEKPRRILHNAGARFVSSLGASKVKNLAYGSHHGGKSGVKGPLIDDAWVFGDVQLVDAEIVRTDGTDASDHNAIKFRIKF